VPWRGAAARLGDHPAARQHVVLALSEDGVRSKHVQLLGHNGTFSGADCGSDFRCSLREPAKAALSLRERLYTLVLFQDHVSHVL
jgi:hypothetical protein